MILLYLLSILFVLQNTIITRDLTLTIHSTATVLQTIRMDRFIGLNFDSSQLRNGIFYHLNGT
jgi:hypothetical protein